VLERPAPPIAEVRRRGGGPAASGAAERAGTRCAGAAGVPWCPCPPRCAKPSRAAGLSHALAASGSTSPCWLGAVMALGEGCRGPPRAALAIGAMLLFPAAGRPPALVVPGGV